MIDPLDRDLFRRIQDRVAIVGIGHLPFAKDIGRPISDTAVEAIQLALDDAGLRAEDVDGMCMLEMEATHGGLDHYARRSSAQRRSAKVLAGRISTPSSVRRGRSSKLTTIRLPTLGWSAESARRPFRWSAWTERVAFASIAARRSSTTKSTSIPLASRQYDRSKAKARYALSS